MNNSNSFLLYNIIYIEGAVLCDLKRDGSVLDLNLAGIDFEVFDEIADGLKVRSRFPSALILRVAVPFYEVIFFWSNKFGVDDFFNFEEFAISHSIIKTKLC